MLLSIDGVQYDIKCEIRRTARVQFTDISGELMDGTYFGDVEGTYYDYEITLKYPLYSQDKYAALYEALTAPVDGHTFILPYNNSTITVTGRVETVPDEQVEMESGYKFWRGMRFEIIANAPTKEVTLSQVLLRGREPVPEAVAVNEGDTYVWDGDKYVKTVYVDGDDTAY